MPVVQIKSALDNAYIYRIGAESWSALHGGAGEFIAKAGALLARLNSSSTSNQFYMIGRSIMVIDTSTLPLGAVISSAKVVLYVVSLHNKFSAEMYFNICNSNPVNINDIVIADYGNLGTAALSTAKAFSSISNGTWVEFILNSAGIDAINKGGATKFGIRQVNDLENSAPTWEAAKEATVTMVDFDPGEALSAYLEVVYAVTPPTVTTDPATNIEDTTTTLNGEIDNVGGENCDVRGFEWGTNQENLENSWTEDGSFGTGTFSHGITGLVAGTTYYCRAKAHNSGGWGYGAVLTLGGAQVFPTLAITRVSNLIHRYNRSLGVYTLEMNLGSVTSEFGIPDWPGRPISAVRPNEQITRAEIEQIAKAAIKKYQYDFFLPLGTQSGFQPTGLGFPYYQGPAPPDYSSFEPK